MAREILVEQAKKRINRVIRNVENSNNDEYEREFIAYLKMLCNNPDMSVIVPFDFCADVCEKISEFGFIANNITFINRMRAAERFFSLMDITEEDNDINDSKKKVLMELIKNDGAVCNQFVNFDLFNVFEDKTLYLKLYEVFKNGGGQIGLLKSISDYALSVREYFAEERAFFYDMRAVCRAVTGMRSDEIKPFLEKRVDMAMRMNGIYDVDAAKLAYIDNKIEMFEQKLESSREVANKLELLENEIQSQADRAVKTIDEKIQSGTDTVRNTLMVEKQSADIIHDEFINRLNEEIERRKDEIIRNMLEDSSDKVKAFEETARRVYASASLEIAKLGTNADAIVKKVQDTIQDDETVKKIIEHANENKQFMDKINVISAIPDTVVKSENVVSYVKDEFGSKAGTNNKAGNSKSAVLGLSDDFNISAQPIQEKEDVIAPTNPLLDMNVPFSERFELAMKRKEKMLAAGEFFHKSFDDVLTAVMENANPYLIGPSGCGKTYMVSQISKILEMDFTDIGYINEEYEILGFQTANGAYSTPNFYRCYKYGIIAFCDELDNGNSRASVKLNSFLSNNVDTSYCFPNGENVKRHPNFRMIAAGNTDGSGADENYNTREKIEESLLQRLLPIYVGYDNNVEKRILAKHEDWYEFVVLFRMATDEWENKNGMSASGIITTRDTYRINRYLDNKSYSDEKIVKYEFIQTKDIDYISFLSEIMKKNVASHAKAENILKIFIKLENELREKGSWK